MSSTSARDADFPHPPPPGGELTRRPRQAALARLPEAAGELGRGFAAGVAAERLRKEGKSLEAALGTELAGSAQARPRRKGRTEVSPHD